ncbi:diguanylate cyclase (GGDEF) domain-containing protein [Rhizobium sp. RU20A]|uniref:GGDEF domain-containing protein n=1 Tax=Rhizobium sp. RU20A TaxID=1907412 RepID=UPI0009558EE1|nr:GGDEF domain-containing protein [Rhizobium sp. RU20A]SIQ88745.1 diguanylate cyclase (GGDEF) domain-containing protein [Rhizobium sp. RU20A]
MEHHDTFAFLLPFFMLCFSLMFLAARRVDDGASLFWGLGFLSAALGFVFSLVVGGLHPLLQSLIANGLFYGGFFFYSHALLIHFRASTIVVPRLLTALAFIVVATMLLAAGDLRSHLAVSDLGCAAIGCMALASVVRRPERPADLAIMLAFGATLIETVARVGVLLFQTTAADPLSVDSFLGSNYAFLMQIMASIFGFLLGLAALATVVTDIIERHQGLAERDPLTELLNRRGFERAVLGVSGSGCILVCDIDHFKGVNDRHGHAAGDRILRDVAAQLAAALPARTLIARFGGEEFVAYLPKTDLEVAGRLAKEACRAIADASFVTGEGTTIAITASFGLAPELRGAASIHEAIAHADACLYLAKTGGRNRVVIHGLAGIIDRNEIFQTDLALQHG